MKALPVVLPSALGALAGAAKKLTAGRKKAARTLAKEVEGALADLAMPGARFR